MTTEGTFLAARFGVLGAEHRLLVRDGARIVNNLLVALPAYIGAPFNYARSAQFPVRFEEGQVRMNCLTCESAASCVMTLRSRFR